MGWNAKNLICLIMKKNMVTPGRLELPTRSLGNCCSIHLSYGATFNINNLQR